MPPRGLRAVTDERQFLTDLGNLFHVVKANHKEQGAVARARARAELAERPNRSPRLEGRPPRGPRRKNRHGGTVWVLLKGGFASANVPAAFEAGRVRGKYLGRAARAEAGRVAALERAEAFVQSAWQQAEDSGLVGPTAETSGSAGELSEDAVEYLTEQYAVAIGMLNAAQRQPAGAYVRSLVEQHCGGRDGGLRDQCIVPVKIAKGSASEKETGEACKSTLTREEWEDLITRENAIYFRFHTGSLGAIRSRWSGASYGSGTDVKGVAEKGDEEAETFKLQMERALSGSGFFYHMAEPAAEVDTVGPPSANKPLDQSGAVKLSKVNDIAATKCIVRIHNSQRQKHTTILSTLKSVNYFKSNFMQVLRKELANSKLPRGPVESTEPGVSAAPAEGKSQAQPHASTGSKRQKKKR